MLKQIHWLCEAGRELSVYRPKASKPDGAVRYANRVCFEGGSLTRLAPPEERWVILENDSGRRTLVARVLYGPHKDYYIVVDERGEPTDLPTMTAA